MSAKVRGITIELGGDASGLEKALNDVNSSIGQTSRALKDVNKLTKLDTGNVEMVAQKQQLLATAVEQTEKKYNILKSAAAEANSALASGQINTNQYQALQREIASTSVELQRLKGQLNSVGTGSFSAQMSALGTNLQSLGGRITSVGTALAPLSAAMAAAAAASVSLASSAEEAGNKVDVVFGDAAGSVHSFAETAIDSCGMAEGSALNMAGTFGAMATSMGISQSSAAQMSTTLVQLAADMASFHNTSVEQSFNALKGVFTGETEALKTFGTVMTETELQAFASSNGINKAFSQMSQTEKIIVRLAYVLNSQKDAIGDFERTSDSTANSIKKMGEAFKELGAAIGGQIAPIITTIVQAITKLVVAFSNAPEGIQKFVAVIMVVAAVAAPVIIVVGSLVSAIGSLASAIPAIAAAMTSLAGALGAALAAFIPIAPVVLGVIAAIAALTIVIVACVKNWDTISEAAGTAGQAIKDAASGLSIPFSNEFSTIKEGAKAAFNGAAETFQSSGGGLAGIIKGAAKLCVEAWKTELSVMTGISRENLSDIGTIFGNSLGSAVNVVKSKMSAIGNAISSGISSAISGIVSGVQSIPEKIGQAISELQQRLTEGVANAFDSVAQKASTWGQDLVENFSSGIQKNIQKAIDAASSLAEGVEEILGFSEPEKGPLSNFHTYAPDMIDLWVKGVKDNLYKIAEVSNTMAETMSPNETVQGRTAKMASSTNDNIGSIANSLANANNSSNITVVLQGDAKGVFKLVRTEAGKYYRTNNYSNPFSDNSLSSYGR